MLIYLITISAEIDNTARLLIINYALVFSIIFDITNTYIFIETAYKTVILLSCVIKFAKT